MLKVGIIDYGIGNLRSVANAITQIGAEPVVSYEPKVLLACSRLILPGVGAFTQGMNALKARQLDKVVYSAVGDGTPLLGICLGMQMLMDSSTEFGHSEGLGLIRGAVKMLEIEVKKNEQNNSKLRLPNVGWLSLSAAEKMAGVGRKMFENIDPSEKFYFIHSYYADAAKENTVATAEYAGISFPAVIGNNNLIGTQFHPEKSGPSGLNLLRQFIY